jgi:WD40 repeat protein
MQDSSGNLYAVEIFSLPAKHHEAATDGQANVPPTSRIGSWQATGLAPRTSQFHSGPFPGETFTATGLFQRNEVYAVTLVESGHSSRITASASIFLDSGESSSTLVTVSSDCTARAWSSASAAAAPLSVFKESNDPSAFLCCVASPALPGRVVVADASGRLSVLGMADDSRSLVRIQAARVSQSAITALGVASNDGIAIVAAACESTIVLLHIPAFSDSFKLITSVLMDNCSVVALAIHGAHVYAALTGTGGRNELAVFRIPSASSPQTSLHVLSPKLIPLPGTPSSLLVQDHASDLSLSVITVTCDRDVIRFSTSISDAGYASAEQSENVGAAAPDLGAATTLYVQYSVYGNSMLSACDDGSVVVYKDAQAHVLAVANAFDGGCTAVAVAGRYVYAATARGCIISFSSPLLPPSAAAPLPVKPPPDQIVISSRSIVEESINASKLQQSQSSESMLGETVAKVDAIKEKLRALLSDNSSAPPDEQLSRFEFVVDSAMQSQLDAECAARVLAAQNEIKKRNLRADLLRDRIMSCTWGSLNEQALVLSSLSKQVHVTTFPICKQNSAFEQQSSLVSYYRSVELAEFALLQAAGLQVSNVHSELQSAFPGSVWCDDRPKHTILDLKALHSAPAATRGPDNSAASSPGAVSSPLNHTGGSYLGEEDEHVDDPRARSISWGCKLLLYPRFDVTSRERRITQAVLLLEEAMSRRASFNVVWKEFQSKKRSAVAKIEERNGRILEIVEELKSLDESVPFNDGSGEDPSTRLQVRDSEISSEVVKAGDDGKVADAGERSKGSELDEASERALQDMMGGKLEGGRDVKLLERSLKAPAWYSEGMTEMSDERAKEFKEWQAQCKALELEKEKYRKTLDTELKKLKLEASSVIDAFDESMGALADLRMAHNSAAFELELLAERCAVLVHAEESAISAIESTQAALPELQNTRNKLLELCRVHEAAAAEDERLANALAAEEKAYDRKLRKELNDQAPIVAEPLLSVLKQVAASMTAQPAGSVPFPSMNADAPPHHVDVGIWQWCVQRPRLIEIHEMTNICAGSKIFHTSSGSSPKSLPGRRFGTGGCMLTVLPELVRCLLLIFKIVCTSLHKSSTLRCIGCRSCSSNFSYWLLIWM